MARWWIGLAFLACSGCLHKVSTDPASGAIPVVATTGMIADVARIVGGPQVDVTELMGPGVDPHQYKASAGDFKKMQSAKLVLYNGLHLEGKMADVFAQMEKAGKIPTVAVTRSFDLALDVRPAEAGFEGTHDPHVWFDVSLWSKTVPEVTAALSQIDPGHADEYAARAKAYQAELAQLHLEVKAELAKIPPERRVIVTAHDAFYYFGRAYGLEVHGLQGISTVSEPSTKDVQELAKLIGTRKVPAIFGESSVPDRNIEAVRDAVKRQYGHQVKFLGERLFSDALGNRGTPEGSYTGMIRHNVRVIREALGS